MSFGEVVIDKEFTTEQSGQRVGWSAFVEVPRVDSTPYYIGNIVVATVGVSGATLSHHEYELKGQKKSGYDSDSASGFESVSALTLTFTKDDGLDSFNSQTGFINGEQNSLSGSNGILLNRASSFRNHYPKEEDKSWGTNPKEILDGLKEQLSNRDIAAYYPNIYHLLNGYIGHESFDGRGAFVSEKLALYLPDPDMHAATTYMLENCGTVERELQASISEDELMKKRLTVYSDVSVEDLPETFALSRRGLAEREQKVKKAAGSLILRQLVYSSVGRGRDWPYMDVEASDETGAFGLELDGLKAGSITRADHELDRELKELRLRRDYAQKGHRSLYMLSIAEQRVKKSRII